MPTPTRARKSQASQASQVRHDRRLVRRRPAHRIEQAGESAPEPGLRALVLEPASVCIRGRATRCHPHLAWCQGRVADGGTHQVLRCIEADRRVLLRNCEGFAGKVIELRVTAVEREDCGPEMANVIDAL